MVDDARIVSKGQMTMPKGIRDLLKIEEGDRLTFICEGDYAIIINTNAAATHPLRRGKADKPEKSGLIGEEEIIALCREARAEIEGL
jgi:AbrB family looped-hinge helix DNA binding protein